MTRMFINSIIQIKLLEDACQRKRSVSSSCHSSKYGGHFELDRTAIKNFYSRFYWLTLFMDSYEFVAKCNKCQSARNINRKNEKPPNNILEKELFDMRN